MRRSVLTASLVLATALGLAASARADELLCTSGVATVLSRVDTATAAGTDVGPTGLASAWAVACDERDGAIYTLLSPGQYLGRFDPATGAVSPIGAPFGGAVMRALEMSADGVLYGLDWLGGLWVIDPATGTRALRGYGAIRFARDLAFDASGTLWAVNGNYLYTIDTVTGTSTAIGPITGILSGYVTSIAFDADDRLCALTWTANAPLYEIDTVTRIATPLGATGLDFPHGGDIPLCPVVDADGDGVPDDVDACVPSDLRPTVFVGEQDSGVPNVLFEDGTTIADLVAACAAWAENHGDFVSRVAALTNALVRARVLSGPGKGALQGAAARSPVGR